MPSILFADEAGPGLPAEPPDRPPTRPPAELPAEVAARLPAAPEPAAATPPAERPTASPPAPDLTVGRAVIKVIGVGGGGGNSVNRMIEADVSGVEFIAVNTDAQVLSKSLAPTRIQIGRDRTGGLGCGGDPEQGRLAARDDMDGLIDAVEGADMVFITVGEGGGTGTGAAPIVACAAQELGALCVAVATKPLGVEGTRRQEVANDGIRELREYVDTLICVPNDRVLEVYGGQSIRAAFSNADDVVRQAVQGISDLIQIPGEINLDFADVRTAMRARGDAVMGIGTASGEDRVQRATHAAIESPLLEDTSIRGATSILVNVTGGEDLTLNEVHLVMEIVREAVAPELQAGYGIEQSQPGENIFLGTAVDPELNEEGSGKIQVTVVATGFPDRSRRGATPRDFLDYRKRATGTDGQGPVFPASGNGSGGSSDEGPPIRVVRTGTTAGRTDPAASPSVPEPTPDAPPGALDPGSDEESRWGDLDTPPFLTRGGRPRG